jgi:hypothetical protein
MYVVIPTAVEPRNLSLPYALASIREHTGYVPITVGYDTGLCDHIPTVQRDGAKHARLNTNLAMRTAIDRLGETFIWSNDDVYWMRPAEPIRWALGDLENADSSKLNRQRKAATAAALKASGLPTFDYEAHVPMLIEPGPMLEALDTAELNPDLEKRSIYGNLTGLPDVIAPDVKLRNPANRHRDEAWASTQGDPARYPHLIGRLPKL